MGLWVLANFLLWTDLNEEKLNTLAHIIHVLAKKEDMKDAWFLSKTLHPALSGAERDALSDLQLLLKGSPQKLAEYLAGNPRPEEWPTASPFLFPDSSQT